MVRAKQDLQGAHCCPAGPCSAVQVMAALHLNPAPLRGPALWELAEGGPDLTPRQRKRQPQTSGVEAGRVLVTRREQHAQQRQCFPGSEMPVGASREGSRPAAPTADSRGGSAVGGAGANRSFSCHSPSCWQTGAAARRCPEAKGVGAWRWEETCLRVVNTQRPAV